MSTIFDILNFEDFELDMGEVFNFGLWQGMVQGLNFFWGSGAKTHVVNE